MRAPFEHFARLLDYPGPDLAYEVRTCAEALAGERPEAAKGLQAFAEAVRQQGTSAIQRQYSAVFDLDPSCSLYAGHQLLGEGWRRSAMMVELRRHFRESRFEEGGELPDHLCTLLRYVSRCPDGEEASDMVAACIAPALARIRDGLARRQNVYLSLVAAVADVLGAP